MDIHPSGKFAFKKEVVAIHQFDGSGDAEAAD